METASQTASQVEVPGGARKVVKIDGRAYTLYKRSGAKDGVYYVQIQREGKRYPKSLETSSLDVARVRAAIHVRDVIGQRWDRLGGRSGRSDAPKLGDVLRVYREKSAAVGPRGGVRPQVARANELRLLAVAREMSSGDPEGLSLNEFTAAAARRWSEALVKRYLARGDGDEHRRSAQRSGASVIRQARSVFNRHMLQAYEDSGLVIPECVNGWLSAPLFAAVRDDYAPASDDVVRQTFRQIADVKGDLNLVRAFWLAVGCGLRAGEMSRVKVDEFCQRDGKPWLVSQAIGKDGKPVAVPVAAGWAELSAVMPAAGPVLQGSDTEVSEQVFRRLSSWMKSIGWTSRRHAHELRSWVICQVAMAHGWQAARDFARHKDVQTTQRKYGRYVQARVVDICLPQ